MIKKSRTHNNLTILLYHGVTDNIPKGVENFSKKHIDIASFEEQMIYLREKSNLMSMDEVIYYKKNNWELPQKAVAVTFDDGFKNNYTKAASILEEHSIPTTFYISAGMINTDLMFWVDIIEDCINRSEKEKLSIHLEKEKKFNLITKEQKINAINEIKRFCKNASVEIKNNIVEQLIDISEVLPKNDISENYQVMSWKEVNVLADNKLFSIGGHTLYHDIMAAQKRDKMRLDISTTISLLNFNLNQKTLHYSYPEGQRIHYNNDVIKALKANGIECCPSAIDGVNSSKDDLFNLKRIMPNFLGRKFPYFDKL